jgi:guanylate cyclase
VILTTAVRRSLARVEDVRDATLLLSAGVITALSCFWVATYAALGLWGSAVIPLTYQLVSLVSFATLARRGRYATFRTTQLALMLILPFVLQWSLGGYAASSAVALWAFTAPLGALLFHGPRPAVAWFAAFAALLVVSAPLEIVLESHAGEIPEWLRLGFFCLNIGGVAVTAFVLLQYFVRARERAHELLAAEQERSERLLLNILPAPIAERLKRTDGMIAERNEQVSVLFADLSGFTPKVERLRAEDVVTLLNRIFSRFDELAERYGIEKIKTIGDGYLAAAGIPTPRPDHAEAIADMALAMRASLAELPDAADLAIRIGIDSGPVVAGVLGRIKFGYDIWGDTVNTASRMESHAPPGSIQVTERTHERLAAEFTFERRGSIEVKGKGAMTTYLLLGRRSGDEAAQPCELAKT